MNTFVWLAPVLCGAYTMSVVHLIDVSNKMSALVLKGIPTVLGACSLLAGLKLWGVL